MVSPPRNLYASFKKLREPNIIIASQPSARALSIALSIDDIACTFLLCNFTHSANFSALNPLWLLGVTV